MRLLRDEQSALLDAGPFFRFSDADKLAELAAYLGERAEITADVGVELRRGQRTGHPNLGKLADLDFPHGEPIKLNPEQLYDVDLIRKKGMESGAHPTKDRGEISTVVLARERTDQLVVIDDHDGIALARANSLDVVQTTHVVAEIVAAGVLTEADGWPIFESVYRERRPSYDALVRSFQQGMA